MEMPKISDEQRRLNALFIGTWQGQETLYPSPLDPVGGIAFGTWVVGPSVDGFALLVDYDQQRGGTIGYRGHGVHAWDVREKTFYAFWFDNTGIVQKAGARATLDAERARYGYEMVGVDRRTRMTYEWSGDTLRFVIEAAPIDAGARWTVFHEGVYQRLSEVDVTS